MRAEERPNSAWKSSTEDDDLRVIQWKRRRGKMLQVEELKVQWKETGICKEVQAVWKGKSSRCPQGDDKR